MKAKIIILIKYWEFNNLKITVWSKMQNVMKLSKKIIDDFIKIERL